MFLSKLILLLFWLPLGSNKPEILGFNFSCPATSFYDTIFKMAASTLNMPYNDPSKLHTIIKLVSNPTFLNVSNIITGCAVAQALC